MTEHKPWLSIGEFAARTQLSVKALRLYDARGLLRPRETDAWSGYRRYAPDQLASGRLIALLRAADLSLEQIESLLAARDRDSAAAAELLDRHLRQLEAKYHGRRVVIGHVQRLLREERDPLFTISTREVPARRLLSIQRRLHGNQTDAFAAQARASFAAHLGGTAALGPFTLVFHGPVNDEADGPLEAVLPVPPAVQPSELVGIRSEPAHTEAYTTITKRQWEYPAILAAYDAVACSPPALARPGSPLSCREVYLADPDTLTPGDPVCEIAFPLADAASAPR